MSIVFFTFKFALMKDYFLIQAKSKTIAEIILYGYIGEWDEISAKRFIVEFRKLEQKYKQINIRINSGGGEVANGTAIYTTIINSTVRVYTYIDGMAASMGSILALAGQKVFMAKHAKLMLHKVSGGAYGSAKKLRETADMMDDWENSLVDIYAQKTGLTTDEVRSKWMQEGKDTWINADDAHKSKLVDEVFDGKIAKEPGNIIKHPHDMWNYYKNQISNLTTNNYTEMDTKITAIKLGLPEDATEEQINAKIAELALSNNALKKENEDLKNAKKIERQESIKNILDKAVLDGKFLEKDRKSWEKMLTDSFESTSKVIEGMSKAIKPMDVIKEGDKNHGKTKIEMSFSEMLEKDRKGLEKLEKDEPEKFKELYKAEYGVYPEEK